VALAAASLLLPADASADDGGNGQGRARNESNGNAHGKDKVKNARGLERAAAIADSISTETGRDAGQYLSYSASLDQTLSEFSAEQLAKIVDGE
jgi:hypothetical protein